MRKRNPEKSKFFPGFLLYFISQLFHIAAENLAFSKIGKTGT